MRSTAVGVASLAVASLLCAGCASSTTPARGETSPTGSVPSASPVAEALACDLVSLARSAYAREYWTQGSTGREAAESRLPGGGNVTRWTGPTADEADVPDNGQLWLLFAADGSGYGLAVVRPTAERQDDGSPRKDAWQSRTSHLCEGADTSLPEEFFSWPEEFFVALKLADEMIGMTEAQATTLAQGAGLRFRVAERDGQGQAMTDDLRSDRVNVIMVDDHVTDASVY